jgi:hypothetical protein
LNPAGVSRVGPSLYRDGQYKAVPLNQEVSQGKSNIALRQSPMVRQREEGTVLDEFWTSMSSGRGPNLVALSLGDREPIVDRAHGPQSKSLPCPGPDRSPLNKRRDMNKNGPLNLIVGCALGSAVLITLLVHGGWLVWVPTLLALVVLAKLWHLPSR